MHGGNPGMLFSLLYNKIYIYDEMLVLFGHSIMLLNQLVWKQHETVRYHVTR